MANGIAVGKIETKFARLEPGLRNCDGDFAMVVREPGRYDGRHSGMANDQSNLDGLRLGRVANQTAGRLC